MKFHPRHSHWLFSLIMSIIVASIVTFVLTAVSHGFQDFFLYWAHSFIIVWVVAFPSVLLVAPVVRRWVQQMTAQ